MSITNSPRRLRAVVVGCGPIGTLHAEAIHGHPAAELVAVCAPTAVRRDPLAARLGVRPYETLAEAIESEHPDCVAIASPDQTHYAQTMIALEGCCHVLCEKPLGRSVREVRALQAQAVATGRRVGVTFNRRYAFGYVQAKQALMEDKIGQVRLILLQATDGTPPPHVADRPDAIFWTWLGHYLDMLRHLGGEVISVSARLGRRPTDRLIQDVDLGVTFESGALGRLVAAYRDGQTRTVERCEIVGGEGGLVVDDATERMIAYGVDPDRTSVAQPNKYLAGNAFYESLRELIVDYLDCLVADRSLAVSVTDALQVARLTEAALEADRCQSEAPLS